MTHDEVKAKVRTFLARYFRNHTPQDDEDIFATGFINSLFAMQLVVFLEQEYGIPIQDEDLDIDNFRTINRITDLVMRKTGN